MALKAGAENNSIFQKYENVLFTAGQKLFIRRQMSIKQHAKINYCLSKEAQAASASFDMNADKL